jgi:anti-sigma factor RsiW
MNRCGISFEALVDYHDGRADAATVARVRAHLDAGCALCQSRLNQLAHDLVALREAVRADQVPDAWVERARQLHRDRFRRPARPSWFARLVFDSRATPSLAGARGEESQAFQLLYSTEEFDLDVWQERAGEDRWHLIGQVLPRQGGGALTPDAATLTSPAGDTWSATLEAGEFHFTDVPSGSYWLSLDIDQAQLVVPEVTVGP